MQKFDLTDAFRGKEATLRALLSEAPQAAHPTTSGDQAELNWVKALSAFLPARYQVRPGFVVDHKGAVSEKQDVIVYDGQYTPLLLEHGGDIYVPAESVYAVLEVKPHLDKTYLRYAGKKVASVRRLERTNGPIVHAGGVIKKPKPLYTIIGGVLAHRPGWKQPLGKKFKEALSGLNGQEALTIGCVLESGSFQVVKGELTVTDEHPLMVFLMNFLAQLRMLGTAPAMELDVWTDPLLQ